MSAREVNFALLRSLLFVPATRPERIEKALRSGADSVCVDLEDAVPPQSKEAARRVLADLPAGDSEIPLMVRINAPGTIEGLRDLLALSESRSLPDAILVPKVGEPGEVSVVASVLAPNPPLVAILEFAAGVTKADQIARHDRVHALLFGSADYCRDTGASMTWDALLSARSRILEAARAARIQAFDGVWPDVHDDQGILDETRRIRTLGFSARAAIHPRQIAMIHQGFRPPNNEVEHARRVVKAFEDSGGAAVLVDGMMVDAPLYQSALATIRSAQV